jgi:hypothetical protein
MNPDVPTPAKKRVRNRAPKPVMPKPEVIMAPCPAVTHDVEPAPLPKGMPDGCAPPKPVANNDQGEKTPAVIRWRLKHFPETMAATYRTWNWQAWLDQNPE